MASNEIVTLLFDTSTQSPSCCQNGSNILCLGEGEWEISSSMEKKVSAKKKEWNDVKEINMLFGM